MEFISPHKARRFSHLLLLMSSRLFSPKRTNQSITRLEISNTHPEAGPVDGRVHEIKIHPMTLTCREIKKRIQATVMKLPRETRDCVSWLVGVAATDKYVYTGDSINRRMLRLKLTYAVEETCRVD